jgi:hypothetical protein
MRNNVEGLGNRFPIFDQYRTRRFQTQRSVLVRIEIVIWCVSNPDLYCLQLSAFFPLPQPKLPPNCFSAISITCTAPRKTQQDRDLWDQQEIQAGLEWLAKSAKADRFSRFHAEAGIAAEHSLAPSFSATRWDRVVECYSLLERIAPSALHRLNRAIAIAEGQGPAAGPPD